MSRFWNALVTSGLMALGLAGLAGTAAEARPAPKMASDKAAVVHSVEAFRAAMIRADGRTLTRLAAPTLSFGHSNGLVQTREQFVQSVVGKKEIFRKIKLVGQKVTVVGRTAVSRHEFHADILLAGKPLNVKLKCIEVWDKTATGWRLVSRQAYKTS
ncbi:MAG: nuclear transport factor 2 family protein [Hyphomicrobiaceae bacterium]